MSSSKEIEVSVEQDVDEQKNVGTSIENVKIEEAAGNVTDMPLQTENQDKGNGKRRLKSAIQAVMVSQHMTTDEECDAMFNEVDKTGDGKIDRKEFRALYYKIQMKAKEDHNKILKKEKQLRKAQLRMRMMSCLTLMAILFLLFTLFGGMGLTYFVVDGQVQTRLVANTSIMTSKETGEPVKVASADFSTTSVDEEGHTSNSSTGSLLTKSGSDQVMQVSLASVKMPLVIAPRLPLQDLEAVKTLMLSVTREDQTFVTRNGTIYTQPGGTHIHKYMVTGFRWMSNTSMNFTTDSGDKVLIRGRKAYLHEQDSNQLLSICAANTDCSFLRVDGINETAYLEDLEREPPEAQLLFEQAFEDQGEDPSGDDEDASNLPPELTNVIDQTVAQTATIVGELLQQTQDFLLAEFPGCTASQQQSSNGTNSTFDQTAFDQLNATLLHVANHFGLTNPDACASSAQTCSDCGAGCGWCLSTSVCLPDEVGWCEAQNFVGGSGSASCSRRLSTLEESSELLALPDSSDGGEVIRDRRRLWHGHHPHRPHRHFPHGHHPHHPHRPHVHAPVAAVISTCNVVRDLITGALITQSIDVGINTGRVCCNLGRTTLSRSCYYDRTLCFEPKPGSKLSASASRGLYVKAEFVTVLYFGAVCDRSFTVKEEAKKYTFYESGTTKVTAIIGYKIDINGRMHGTFSLEIPGRIEMWSYKQGSVSMHTPKIYHLRNLFTVTATATVYAGFQATALRIASVSAKAQATATAKLCSGAGGRPGYPGYGVSAGASLSSFVQGSYALSLPSMEVGLSFCDQSLSFNFGFTSFGNAYSRSLASKAISAAPGYC